MIVSFNDKTTAVGLIPFPAVTVCSTKKFDNNKLDADHLLEILGDIEKNSTVALSHPSKEYVVSRFWTYHPRHS